MKISEIIVKKLGAYQMVEIACPACDHRNQFRVDFEGRERGLYEGECPWCHAVIGFQWEK